MTNSLFLSRCTYGAPLAHQTLILCAVVLGLLAGDFYANYRWTAGVLGNHDRLKEPIPGSVLLDGQVEEFDGLRVGDRAIRSLEGA